MTFAVNALSYDFSRLRISKLRGGFCKGALLCLNPACFPHLSSDRIRIGGYSAPNGVLLPTSPENGHRNGHPHTNQRHAFARSWPYKIARRRHIGADRGYTAYFGREQFVVRRKVSILRPNTPRISPRAAGISKFRNGGN